MASKGEWFLGCFIIFVLGALYYRRTWIKLRANEILAGLAVLFCIVCMTGQMYNRINRPPEFRMTNNGMQYLAKMRRKQYVWESYVAGACYGLVTTGVLLIMEVIQFRNSSSRSPHNKVKGKYRKIQVIVGLTFICVFFSVLTCMMKYKINYPYSIYRFLPEGYLRIQ